MSKEYQYRDVSSSRVNLSGACVDIECVCEALESVAERLRSLVGVGHVLYVNKKDAGVTVGVRAAELRRVVAGMRAALRGGVL